MLPIRVIYYPRNADYRLVELGGERFVQFLVRPGCNWVRHNRMMIHSQTDDAAIREFREWFQWTLVFAELKRDGQKPSNDQQKWLDALALTRPAAAMYCWTPRDWPKIEEVLTRKKVRD